MATKKKQAKAKQVLLYEQFCNIKDNCDMSVDKIMHDFDELIAILEDINGNNTNDPIKKNGDFDSWYYIDLITKYIDSGSITFKYTKFLHGLRILSAEKIKYNNSVDPSKNFNFNIRHQLYHTYGDDSKLKDLKVFIVGGGIAGLRLAINLIFYGCNNIKIIDKRDYFSRKQIVRIWESTEKDLISLGIRTLLPKFTKSNEVKTIIITYLQHFLLRLLLLMGIKIDTGIQFERIDKENSKVVLSKKVDQEWERYSIDNDFDVIVDASGTSGVVRDSPMNITNENINNNNDNNTNEAKNAETTEINGNADTKEPESNENVDNIDENKAGNTEINNNESSPTNGTGNSDAIDDGKTVEFNDNNTNENIQQNGDHSEMKMDNTSNDDTKSNDANNVNDSKDNETDDNNAVIPLIGVKPRTKKAQEIIGITANFKRAKGDFRKDQLSLAAYANAGIFKQKSVRLENIVYYRSEISNYIVATVLKKSLKKHKVFKNSALKHQALLTKDNVNIENLEKLILSVLNDWKIPYKKKAKTPFILTPNNKRKDFGIFEFGDLKEAKVPMKFIKLKHKYQLITTIGDSCYAPFWPLGTGVNHAFIGVCIITNLLNKWWNSNKRDISDMMESIELEGKELFFALNKDLRDQPWHREQMGHNYVPIYAYQK